MTIDTDRRLLMTAGLALTGGLGLAACDTGSTGSTSKTATATGGPAAAPVTGHADVDGLKVYYEIHGGPLTAGKIPLVVLHGGMLAIETGYPAGFIARFAAKRPVIAIEQQGHGHTADRAGPITLDRMTRDTAGVLIHLKVAKAHFLGHSLGGMIATDMAVRYPSMVASATPIGSGYTLEGLLPELVTMQRNPAHKPSAQLIPLLPTEADFAAWQAHYKKANPNPDGMFAVLERMNAMLAAWRGWTPAELAAIRAPFLVMIGDNDFIRIEHAAEMKRLIPGAWLSVLPNTLHMTALDRGNWIESMFEARIAG